MDQIFAQAVVGIFLLMLGGICGFILTRITKQGDALADALRSLDVAKNDIEHLKEKTGTHTNHIDTLFQMRATIDKTSVEVETLSRVLPQITALMQQLATIALKKAA